MASTTVFKNKTNRKNVPTNTVNNAGGRAYKMENRHQLAQLVCTGCFNNTFYTNGEDQAKQIIALCRHIEPDFIAKCAIYARNKSYMKDSPALLVAILSTYPEFLQFEEVFRTVINNGKMLRNFVQIIRSGVVGRKCFGSRLKRIINNWLENQTVEKIFEYSVGNSPSMYDIIKLIHPKASSKTRSTLYGYILGKSIYKDSKYSIDKRYLPKIVKDFEKFKSATKDKRVIPDVSFQMLTALDLSDPEWKDIALQSKWQTLRMNLNTFERHGVLKDSKIVKDICKKLVSKEDIKKSKVFPYQLMAAFNNVNTKVPVSIKNALQDAAEISLDNIPNIEGKIYVCVDTSSSMGSPVTGYRKGSTTSMSCLDVASMFAASISRKNDDCEIIPFDTDVYKANINNRDSIMTISNYLRKFGGGGTNCSLPLARLNEEKAKGDLVIYISDNESWADRHYGSGTRLSNEWNIFKKRNPNAKLVCIDLTPNTTTQINNRIDALNIGGWSDSCFSIISDFVKLGNDKDKFVSTIEKIKIS